MRKAYTAERITESRTFYTFTDPTPAGERLQVEVTRCTPDNTSSRSLPRLWHEAGYTAEVLPNYWSLQTYVTDAAGACYGRYNPQTILGANKINFAFMLEATPENLERLLTEVYNLATLEG